MKELKIIVLGAGIAGLWQALICATRGHNVTLVEKSKQPFTQSASQYAGAMLAPFCEAETVGPLVEKLGVQGLQLWKNHYPQLQQRGSLALAQPREKTELKRFARRATGHVSVGENEIANLEPDLAGRYKDALYFAGEAHLDPRHALPFLLKLVEKAGAKIIFGAFEKETGESDIADWVIDCRGMAAQDVLSNLRGIRGERLVIRSKEIVLNRAVHLLHPRFPLYIVPWSMNGPAENGPKNEQETEGGNIFMIGATMIETSSNAAVSVRSALELLSSAYALHPALAEAQIVSFDVGIRPAFPDNLPKIVVAPRKLYVNGFYRNGFLLAPALAEKTAHYIETGKSDLEVFVEDYFER